MSVVLAVCGLEKNIGVTSLGLFLGQSFAEVTGKKSLVVDFDIENPEMKEILEYDRVNNYNIDNVMTYAAVEGTKLQSVIKSNTIPFLNSKLSVIYGTNFKERKYTDIQVSNFLQDVRANNDFVVIDCGTSILTKTFLNNVDMVFVVCPPSEKYIRAIGERKDYDHKKVEYILNMNSKGLNMKKIFKKLYNKNFFAELPFCNTVQTNINKGFLDFDGGAFQTALYDFNYKILDRYELKGQISTKFLFGNDFLEKLSYNPVVSKIWGKHRKKEKTLEDRVKSINNHIATPKLGEVLIQLGYINLKQLETALDKQDQVIIGEDNTEHRGIMEKESQCSEEVIENA